MGARARYNANVRDGQDGFEYTFYYLAPSSFLAREPTAEEKTEFVHDVVTKYNPRVMGMRSFSCAACKRPADQHVDFPTYALHDPSALAINNTIFAVCTDDSCHAWAHEKIDMVKHVMAQRYDLRAFGPEIVACRNCHRQG